MPLFFTNKDSKRRLEHQLCASKEAGADDILDISACELSEVPSCALSICHVVRKKVLILHGNKLKSLLPKGCDIGTLATIKILDLHNNRLTSLPDDIGSLASLQVLNVAKNQLESLPDSIGDLRLLQTLDVRANRLGELPPSVGRLSSLRILDVSGNTVHRLPKSLGRVRTMEILALDTGEMSYPPASVCAGGAEDVQSFLCAELGEEYQPPSLYLLPALESRSSSDCSEQQRQDNSDGVGGLEQVWRSKFGEYEEKKERKREETLAAERHLAGEARKEQARLLLASSARKEELLHSVRLEQERMEQGVSRQRKVQDADRLSLLETVRRGEDGFDHVDQQKRNAETFRVLEEDRIRMERLTAVTQEEASSLREREVAAAMQRMLSDGGAMDLLQEANDRRRRDAVSEACRSAQSLDRTLDRAISLRQLDKSKAIGRILEEEEMQKAAFQALQLQKDGVHGHIRQQIALIEARLMQLSQLELKRCDLDAENLREALEKQRPALGHSLQQLLKQKDQRETELKRLLVEMEKASASGRQNYWMIQYQRLLESEPPALRVQEAAVDPSLVALLSELSAQRYLPVLAHHRVTGGEVLRRMSASDLGELGVRETGVQEALLDWAARQQHRLSATHAADKGLSATHDGDKGLSAMHDDDKVTQQRAGEEEATSSWAPSPSTPPEADLNHHHHRTPSPPSPTPGTRVTPSASGPVEGPPLSGSGECVVCMDASPQVIFLPCGHVCCCPPCGDALRNCPLCRNCISQHVRLYRP